MSVAMDDLSLVGSDDDDGSNGNELGDDGAWGFEATDQGDQGGGGGGGGEARGAGQSSESYFQRRKREEGRVSVQCARSSVLGNTMRTWATNGSRGDGGFLTPPCFFVLSALLWCATTVPLAVFIYVTTAILTTIPGLFTIAARWILILWVLCPFRLHVAHCASSTVLRAYVRFFSEVAKASKISASLVPLKSLCIRSLMVLFNHDPVALLWVPSL